MLQTYKKIVFFGAFLLLFMACNTTKYVPEDDTLLRKNTIMVDGKKSNDSDLYGYIVQKPNSSVFGIPISTYIYNLGDPNFEVNLQEWAINHPQKFNFFKKYFSLKQTQVVYNTNKGFNDWFLKKGRAPVIYNSAKAERTTKSLEDYFFTQGYFDANVSFDEVAAKENQTDIVYKVTPKERYKIDTIFTEISSPVLDSLYQLNKKESILKPGNPFVFDDFEKEQKRLDNLFKNSGIYHFNPNSIGFWTDSLDTPKRKNITLRISDRIISTDDSTYTKPYEIQRINKVNVFIDQNRNQSRESLKDSAYYDGISYYSPNKLKYRPKRLDDAIFMYPDSIWRNESASLTMSHLRKSQNFKAAIDMRFKDNGDETLDANIYLQSLKKYAFTFDLDATTSNIKPFGILGKFSFLNRNLFKGAEIFELSFQGSFLNVSNDASNDSRFFNAWEFITQASLTIPRIFFPIETESIIPKEMSPLTIFDLSIGTQKNIGLDRQTLTSGLSYAWRSTNRLGHKLDLFNLQLIKNENVDNYFSVYNSEYEKLNLVSKDLFGVPLPNSNPLILRFMDIILNPENGFEQSDPNEYNVVSDVHERREILIEDVLVPVISYSINYNTKENLADQDFYFLSARVVASGNLTSAISTKSNENGQKLMFGLPIAQYLKTEFEFKRYWNSSRSNVFVFRSFIGAAFPYGNSTNIPFSRSYSAGGSNDIRGWRTYDLGPGSERNLLEYNVGTFKIVSNFEYRFNVLNKIFGALFVDAGNIWDITNSNLVSDNGKFTGFSSLEDVAVASGFGIRYDFGFLIFRFDTGFKTYEPYLIPEKRWFTNYNFGNAVYNIGINYPF